MARWETLMARDGHEFASWLAPASGPPRGAVVILQEIFGVNEHIRSVVEQYAAAGFVTIAPALFDRIHRNIELGYGPKDIEQGRGYKLQLDRGKAMLDIGAAANVVRHAGRVALVGYCFGGLLAWLGAGALPVHAAVSYYGAGIGEQLGALPRCPVMLHYGEQDASIPLAEVARIQAAFPSGHYHLYPAGHGFACNARGSYDDACARLAWQRTQDFLKETIG